MTEEYNANLRSELDQLKGKVKILFCRDAIRPDDTIRCRYRAFQEGTQPVLIGGVWRASEAVPRMTMLASEFHALFPKQFHIELGEKKVFEVSL